MCNDIFFVKKTAYLLTWFWFNYLWTLKNKNSVYNNWHHNREKAQIFTVLSLRSIAIFCFYFCSVVVHILKSFEIYGLGFYTIQDLHMWLLISASMHIYIYIILKIWSYSNMLSFFRFVNIRAIYWLDKISLAHVPVHVTDFPVVNVHVDELSFAQIWQHKLCATLSANENINYCLPIKVYCRICTLRHIRIKIIHGSQNVFWVLTWVGEY